MLARGWTIKVEASVPNADWKVVGQRHVVVPAGARVDLLITLDPGARLNP